MHEFRNNIMRVDAKRKSWFETFCVCGYAAQGSTIEDVEVAKRTHLKEVPDA